MTGKARGPRSDAELILRAAARVPADDPRATIQRIADEAGLVRMTVHRRYRNRDALRRAIHDAAAAEATAVIDATAGPSSCHRPSPAPCTSSAGSPAASAPTPIPRCSPLRSPACCWTGFAVSRPGT